MGDAGRRLYLFDDRIADAWAPFALTRPCGELRWGRWLLRERVERVFGLVATGHVTRPWLRRYREPGAPPVVPADDLPADAPRRLWSARAAPLAAPAPSDRLTHLWVDGRLAGLDLPAGEPGPDPGWHADPVPLPGAADLEVSGAWLDHPWELVSRGPARLAADLEEIAGPGHDILPDGCWLLGEGAVRLGRDVRLEPGVLFDTRQGAIELGEGVEVRSGTRLRGPLHAGARSRLLGGDLSALAAGPFAFLRGEIEHTIVLGYTNKAHDGFLGHALVGCWVNLGAMTSNSDLKNNYGSVRVGPPGAEIDTGLVKLGSLIGDHAKTGIGVLLNTGTVVGAGSNLFGAALPPKWVPPFSWGQGSDLTLYRREAFLRTATSVMRRRGIDADAEVLGWLGDIWDRAALP